MKNFLVYTLVTLWNEPPRARHQVTNELAKLGKVYFVERNRTGKPGLHIYQEENVTIISPSYWVPSKVRYRIAAINNHYHHWLLSKLKELDLNIDVCINFDYTATNLSEHFPVNIFYCVDDNVGFGKFNPAFINKYHTHTESVVASNATLCIVTSDYMLAKLKPYNKNSFLVPLGAPPVNVRPVFKEAKLNELPVLGIVGYLDSNLDYALLNRLMDKFTIVFIGPVNKSNQKKLHHPEHAIFTGTLTGTALYDKLQEADVCIAPYDIAKLNKGATPNKMWLYLALGKPAVITSMPNIENWEFEKDTVYICTNDVFIKKCEEAYANNSPELMKKRIKIANENLWANRVSQVLHLLEDVKELERLPLKKIPA